MTTAQQIIDRAALALELVPAGVAADSADSTAALATMNHMLDTWQTERLYIYQKLQESASLVAGTSSYTMGSGGTFSGTRPVKLLGGFVRRSGVDYPVIPLDREGYNRIPDKTVQSIPQFIYLDKAYPVATLYLYPVPDAADTLFLDSWKQLGSIATLSTSISFPPGYESAMVYNLCVWHWPRITERSVMIQQMAKDTKEAVKRLNLEVPMLRTHWPGRYNIYTDEYR